MKYYDVCGVILAGGQSRRMGSDKTDLVWQGQSLLDRAKALLESLQLGEILVNRNHHPGCLPDKFPGKGPLSGIHSALIATHRNLLAIPVDMPLLSPTLLTRLLEASKRQRACYFADYPIPFFLANTDSIRAHLQTVLSDSTNADLSVRSLLKFAQADTIPCPCLDQLTNINTPMDMALLSHQ